MRGLDNWLTREPDRWANCAACGIEFDGNDGELCDECEAASLIVCCPICDAPNEPLGILGNLPHYRCRACGLMYNHPETT